MMSGKYGEPWHADPLRVGLILRHSGYKLKPFQASLLGTLDDLEARDRIILCVNACAALTDEQLSGGVVALEDVAQAIVDELESENWWSSDGDYVAICGDDLPHAVEAILAHLTAKPPTAND